MKETKIRADHEGKVLILRLYPEMGGGHITCLFLIYECSLRKNRILISKNRTVLVRVSVAVKTHHDQNNSYKEIIFN